MIFLMVLFIIFLFLDRIIDILCGVIGMNEMEEQIDKLYEENLDLIDINKRLLERIAQEDKYNGWAEK